MRSLICMLLLSLSLHAAYKAEGFGSYYDHEERLFLMATFLPFNPTILSLKSTKNVLSIGRKALSFI